MGRPVILMNFIVLIWVHLSFAAHGIESIVNDGAIRGVHLKVCGYEFPPSMSIAKTFADGNVTYKGSAVEMTNYFSQHLQMSVEYVPQNVSVLEKKGQIFTAIQAVANKEVDFCTFPWGTASIELWPIMDFISLVMQEPFNIISPWPKEESRLTAVIRPFNLVTWIMILFSSFALVAFVSSLPSVYGLWNDQGSDVARRVYSNSYLQLFGKAVMYVVAIFTQHGTDPRNIGISNRLSLRLMLGLWLLMMVILANLYMSTITSFMTVVKLEPIPNSLEELTFNYDESGKECLVTMQKDHPVLKIISNSTRTSYRKMYEWIKQNPQFSTNAFNEIAGKILEHQCAQIGTITTHTIMISRDLKTNEKCRMTQSLKPLDFAYSLSFQLQKNSPFTSVINKYVLRSICTGLLDYWRKWSHTDVDKFRIDKNSKVEGKVKPIKLVELSSAFLVLGVGLAMSTLAFLVERFIAPRIF